MSVTRSPRFRLHRWDSGADPYNRAQNDTDNLQVETLGAIFRQGPLTDIGDPTAAAYARSFFYDTTNLILYFCDGTNWVSITDAGEVGDIQALTIGGSGSAGSVSTASGIKTVEFALANHVHPMPAAAAPVDTGIANAAGSAATLARSDHVHAIGSGSINSSGSFAAGVVNTAAIGSSAVTTVKIADANVTTAKIADANVTTAKVADASITGPKLAASVAGSGLGQNVSTGVLDVNVDGTTIAVSTDTLGVVAGGIGTTQLAATSVTTAKIADGAVTTAKVADGGITGPKLAASVAGSGLSQNGTTSVLDVNVDGTTISITTDALGVAAGGIGTTQLASAAVTAAKIASAALSASGAITGGAGTALSVAVDNSTIEISSNALRLKDAGVTSAKLATGAVTSTAIAAGAVDTAALAAASVTAAKLASSTAGSGLTQNGTTKALDVAVDNSTLGVSVGTLKVLTGGITATQLASNAVTTTAVADAAITTAKIADGAVTTAKLAGSVSTGQLADGSITTAKLADSAVTAVKLGTGAVTTTKLGDASVTGVKLAAAVAGIGLTQNVSGNIDVKTSTTISVNASNELIVTSGAVGATQLGSDAVTTVKIVDGAVTSAKLGAGAVGAAAIGSGALGAGLSKNGTTGVIDINVSGPISISSNAVTIAAGAISSTYLGSGAVNTAALGSNAVTTVKIADGAVTPLKLDATIAGAGLTRNSGTGILTVNVDGLSIVNPYGPLAIATGGVGTNELAANAVTYAKAGAGVYRNVTGQTGGAIRYSTAAPSGSGYSNGDLWLRYTA